MTTYWDKPSPLHEKAAEMRCVVKTGTWRLSWDTWCKLRAEPQSIMNISFSGNPTEITLMGLPIVIAPNAGIMEIVQ